MAKFNDFPNGTFSWVDLNSRDQQKAKAFYTGLFGWEAQDKPIGGGAHYTMFLYNGEAVAGCGQMDPDMMAGGMPSVWMSYVRTDDVDAVAQKVTAAGGTVMMPPMDVMEEGRMALFADPTGTAFGAWQPKNHKGAGLCNEPNTLCWNELQTRDITKNKDFYAKVWGWTYEEMAMPDGGTYLTIKNGDNPNGGFMALIGPQFEGVPPNWQTYFAVADIEATMKKAKDLGGTVHVGPQKISVGTFAIIQDPSQGTFTALQMNPMDG